MVCSHQYVFVINWWLQEREKKKKPFTCPSLIRIIKENIKGKAGQDVYFKQTRRSFLLCLILHLGNFTSSLPSKVAENSFTVARGYNSKTKACNLTYLQKKNIQGKQSNSIRPTRLVVLGHLWSWEGHVTSAFKGDSLPAGKKGLGEEKEDWKGAVGLKSLSFHFSPRWAGLQRERTRGQTKRTGQF